MDGGEGVGVGCWFDGWVWFEEEPGARLGPGRGVAVETRGRLFVVAILVVIP
jgi:hypothetical protein